MKFHKASAAIFVVIISSLLITGNALAHALLVRSLPVANSELTQPPAKIELWFSEPVEEGFSSARLFTTSGDEITVGKAQLDLNDPYHLTVPLSRLSPGIYTVSYVTLSRTDGHEWTGSFPFTVLNSDGSRPSGTASASDEVNIWLPTFAQTVSRWLALMGGILFVSVPLFLLFVTPNSGKSDELGIRFNALGIKINGLGVLAIFIGSWLQFALQANQLENLNLLPKLVYGTHSGSLALARQALTLGGLLIILKMIPKSTSNKESQWIFITGAILEACILILILLSGIYGEWVLAVFTFIIIADAWGMAWYLNQTSESTDHQAWTLVLALGLVTLFLFSIGSHASAVPGSIWAVFSDFIHLLATSAWIGGLMLLTIMLEQMRRSSAIDKSVLGPLFRRYGYMAKFSFFLLITTGLFNSLVHFPAWISLFNTFYGQVLLIKLLLVIIVWWLSLRSSNNLRRPADPSNLSDNLQRFIRQISLAALIGLFLMVAVAALVQTQPPVKATAITTPANLPFISHFQADDLTIHVQVTPNQVGSNHFKVFLSHEDDSPIGEVQLVRLLFNYQDSQIGQSSVDLKEQDVNIFGIEGAYLNQPGTWKLSIYVRRRGLDDTIADVGSLNLPAPAAQNAAPFGNPVTNIPTGELLAGAMMILGFEIYRWRQTFKQAKPKLYSTLMWIGFCLFFIGLILLSYTVWQSGVIFLPEN